MHLRWTRAPLETTPGYMAMAFPALFPDGAGDFYQPRLWKIELRNISNIWSASEVGGLCNIEGFLGSLSILYNEQEHTISQRSLSNNSTMQWNSLQQTFKQCWKEIINLCPRWCDVVEKYEEHVHIGLPVTMSWWIWYMLENHCMPSSHSVPPICNGWTFIDTC